MPIGTRYKDPDSTRKYTIDWTPWLRSQTPGEVITESEWIVPEGLTLNDEGFENFKTVVWLSSGTVGATYTVVNRVTTSVGQIQDASIELIMEHK